jgi:class 3 adenylate cyclase
MNINEADYKKTIEKIEQLERENAELKLLKKNSEENFKKEKENSEALLLNILPWKTAKELKETGKAIPKYFPNASVLFTDFKDFTLSCENLTPFELVDTLHFYFKQFDEIVTKYGLEKIKTIGDSYLCVGGIPMVDKQHPFKIVMAALEIQKLMNYYNEEELKVGKEAWKLRVGIHTGGLITGVVGEKKFAFDVWGDTVNIAARMESSGEVGKVNISESTYELVKDYFEFTSRGMIEVKNKGKIKMYFVDGIKPKNVMNQEGFIIRNDGSGRV